MGADLKSTTRSPESSVEARMKTRITTIVKELARNYSDGNFPWLGKKEKILVWDRRDDWVWSSRRYSQGITMMQTRFLAVKVYLCFP